MKFSPINSLLFIHFGYLRECVVFTDELMLPSSIDNFISRQLLKCGRGKKFPGEAVLALWVSKALDHGDSHYKALAHIMWSLKGRTIYKSRLQKTEELSPLISPWFPLHPLPLTWGPNIGYSCTVFQNGAYDCSLLVCELLCREKKLFLFIFLVSSRLHRK